MAIRFATNVPQILCFPYGDFKEVTGQYGEQFLYTVEVDNARDRLYATPILHEQTHRERHTHNWEGGTHILRDTHKI